MVEGDRVQVAATAQSVERTARANARLAMCMQMWGGTVCESGGNGVKNG